jgi:hypothetical protein
MAEKVGGIEYTVDADTSSLKTAGEAVTSSTNKMVDDFGKVDKQQEKSNQASKKATDVTVKETKAQVNAREVAARKIVRSQERVAKEIKDLAAKNQRTAEKTAQVIAREAKEQAAIAQREARQTSRIVAAETRKKAQAVEVALKQEAAAQKEASLAAAKSTGNMGRKAGMAGIQIEQFVGSVQGGQDAMRAFSFQATDMGIVLGVPLVGAAIGLTTALVSALMPALFNSGKEVDSLKEKLIELAETQLLSVDQAKFMAQEEAKTQKEKKKTIDTLTKELATKKKSLAALKAEMETAKNLASNAANTARKTEALRIPERIKAEEEAIITKNAMLSIANKEYKDGATKIAAYKVAISGATEQTGEQKKAVESLIKALNLEDVSIGKNNRALLELRLEKEEASKADTAAALAIFDSIDAKNKEIKANKIASDVEKKKTTAMSSVLSAYQSQAAQLELNSKQLDEYNARKRIGLKSDEQIPLIIQAEIDALEALRKKKAEMVEQDKANQALQKEFKAIQIDQGQADDPLVALEEKLAAEREIIKAHTDLLLANEQLTQEQRNAIIQQGQDLRTSIDEDSARARQNIADMENKSKLNAVSQMFSSISSLMNTESKKMFEIGKAAAVAGAIVDGYAAITGAYKVGAKIGGPVLGGAFAAAAAVQTAVQIQNIAKQKIGGAQSMGASGSFSGGAPVTNTQPQAQGGTNVNVSGINPGDMFTGQQLMDTLRSVVGDGADVSFLTSG